MTEKEKIEKMAKEFHGECKERECEKCFLLHYCKAHRLATKIYNAGYCKASEVALEIIDYIKKHLKLKRKMIDFPATCRDTKNYQCGAFDILNYFDELANELEKEYTEGKQ